MYDETIVQFRESVEKAKIGNSDKQQALKNLTMVAQMMEESFEPDTESFDKVIEKERRDSYKYGGRTVFGKAKPPGNEQLSLFD